MKIIKRGKTIPFTCNACDCEFVAGIHSLETFDGNYYATCPMCGCGCHTDVARIEMYKAKQKELKKNQKEEQCNDCIYKTNEPGGCSQAALAYFLTGPDGECRVKAKKYTNE